MMTIPRKIRSALDYLLHGQFIKFFNAMMIFLRLHPAVAIGDSYLFSIDPLHSRSGIEVMDEPDESIRCETDPAIIDKLLACMEGTTDFPWIKPEDRQKKFEDFFRQGYRVWIIDFDSEVVGFIWEARRSYSYTYGDRTLVFDDLPENEAFHIFLFINGSWRSYGLHIKLFEAVHRASPNVRFTGVVTEENERSIQSHLIYGFRQSGRILHFRCFGLVFASLRFGKIRRFLFRIKKDVPYRISCAVLSHG